MKNETLHIFLILWNWKSVESLNISLLSEFNIFASEWCIFGKDFEKVMVSIEDIPNGIPIAFDDGSDPLFKSCSMIHNSILIMNDLDILEVKKMIEVLTQKQLTNNVMMILSQNFTAKEYFDGNSRKLSPRVGIFHVDLTKHGFVTQVIGTASKNVKFKVRNIFILMNPNTSKTYFLGSWSACLYNKPE